MPQSADERFKHVASCVHVDTVYVSMPQSADERFKQGGEREVERSQRQFQCLNRLMRDSSVALRRPRTPVLEFQCLNRLMRDSSSGAGRFQEVRL